MIKLLKKMKPKDRLLALLCVFLVAGQIFLDLKLPDYTKEVTVLISTGSTVLRNYYAAGGKMLLCALISALLSVVVGYFSALISSDFSFSIREQIFNKVASFGTGEIKKFSTASLITRTTNDVMQMEMIIGMGLQMIVKAPVMAVWAIIKIINKNFTLSIMTAGAVVIIVTTMVILMIIVVPRFKIVQRQIDSVNQVTQEHLTGLRVVRAFNAEDYQENKFENTSRSLMNTQLFNQHSMAFLSPIMTLVQSALSLGIYYVGALMIEKIKVPLNGSLASMITSIGSRADMLGDVIIFNSYALYVIMSFILLMAIIIILPRAAVSAGRINEVLEADIAVREGSGTKSEDEKGSLEFRNVSFRYPDASDDCLKHISFRVNPGETVAFIGATGSGKTTLVNLAARLYDATEGEILLDSVDIREYSFEELYRKLGYVLQKAVLFSDSVRNNISFGDCGFDITDEDIIQAADIAQAVDFIQDSEEKLDKVIAQGGTNVSGGQKQRLSIARAIARKPEILIFDDSFSALDYKTDKALRSRLRTDLAGTTCLIVAQRIGTIRNADKIIVLDDGEAVGIGTHEELMASCSVYQEIALSQLTQAELD